MGRDLWHRDLVDIFFVYMIVRFLCKFDDFVYYKMIIIYYLVEKNMFVRCLIDCDDFV